MTERSRSHSRSHHHHCWSLLRMQKMVTTMAMTVAAVLVITALFSSSFPHDGILPTAEATKHTFTTRHDRRLFVGPIGPTPFGLAKNGVYNISVLDYHLVATNQYEEKLLIKQMREKEKRQKKAAAKNKGEVDSYSNGSNNGGASKEDWQIDYKNQIPANKKMDFEAAFVLAKFDTYAEFVRYTEGMLSADAGLGDMQNGMVGSSCAFDLWNTPTGQKIPAKVMTKDNRNHKNVVESHNIEGGHNGDYDRNAIILHAFGHETYSKPSMVHTFRTPEEEGEYYLFYQVCMVPLVVGQYVLTPKEQQQQVMELMEHYRIESSFELDIEMYNVVGGVSTKDGGAISYLAAGDMPLPKMYLVWTLVYLTLSIVWIRYIHHQPHIASASASNTSKANTHHIHYIMFVLLLLKTASLLAESIRYHYIGLYGHTAFWSMVYYGFVFLKSTTLFTTMLLIGSGWSFLKPYLSPNEKKILWVVLGLQISTNLVVMILSSEDKGEQTYEDWVALLHLMDIICCAVILFPIVWQVHNLETQTDHFNKASSPRRSRRSRHDDGDSSSSSVDDSEDESEGDFSDGYYEEAEDCGGATKQEEERNGVHTNIEHQGLLTTVDTGNGHGSQPHPMSPRQQQDLQNLSTDQIQEKRTLLQKLKLFRTFYMVVVGYIYMTRIVVFMLQEHLLWKFTWLEPMVEEIATVAFYVWVGTKFRPRVNNPLFTEYDATGGSHYSGGGGGGEGTILFQPDHGQDSDHEDDNGNDEEGIVMSENQKRMGRDGNVKNRQKTAVSASASGGNGIV